MIAIVILDKKKVYAIKEENLIFEGYRNKIDGSWDIQVQKKCVQENNYRIAIQHGLTYKENGVL